MKEHFRHWMLAATLAAVAGCDTSHADPAQAPSLPVVSVVHPRRADAVRSLTLPGDLVGFYEAALHAKVSGYLQSIAVDKGDTVRRGQVLAEIEVPELEQKLKRARANREIRRLTQERLEHVWSTDKRLVAREDVDIAESQYQQAQAEVEELEAMMSYTHIVAPFDGVVTGRFFDPGALIQASGSASTSGGSATAKGGEQPVLGMAELSRLRVYVYVPENETSDVREGLPATLTLKEFPGRTFEGTVARFSRSLDLATRTMLTEVDLENPSLELYPGMYADVRLDLVRHPAALELPSTAIGTGERGSFVYLVRDGRLEATPVRLGITSEGWVEITDGVAEADEVVTNLGPTLHQGEPVRSLLAAEDGSPAQAKSREHKGA